MSQPMDTTPDAVAPAENVPVAAESSTSTQPQDEPMQEEDDLSELPEDVLSLSVEEINARARMVDNEIKVSNTEYMYMYKFSLKPQSRSCAQRNSVCSTNKAL